MLNIIEFRDYLFYNMGDSISGTVLAVALVVILLAIYIHFNPEILDRFRRKEQPAEEEGSEALIGSHELEPTEPNEMSVDMVDFRHDDPKFSKYTRRMRDTVGMDGSDYYYENDALFRQGVLPEKEGEVAFESTAGLRNETVPGQRGDWRTVGEAEGYDDDVHPSSRWHGSVSSAEPAIGGAEDLELLKSGLSFTGHRYA